METAKRRVGICGTGQSCAVVGLVLSVLVAFAPSVASAAWQTYTLVAVPGPDDCWTSAALYPIGVGNYWTTITDGDTANPETEIVSAGTKKVNGAKTSIIDADGLLIYVTNNSNGLRMHGSFSPDNDMGGGVFADGTMTFSPPMQMLNPVTCVGDHISSSGNNTIAFVGYPQIVATYTYNSDVMAEETVSVPFGTFQSVRLQSTMTFSYPAYMGLPPEAFTDTTWYVPGIGPVKSILTDSISPGSSVVELTDTNLTPVPEPSLAWMQAAALIGLGTLSRLRRAVA